MIHRKGWLAVAVLIVFLLLPESRAACQGLSPLEETMAEYLTETEEEAIAFLERVVNINSGTMNHEGVREVGRIFREELDALGFETRWVDLPPEADRAGQLFGKREGNGTGPKILMIGHMDTVFEEDSPFQRFRRVGDMAYGPGVIDMKSGDVAILYALKAMAHAGVLDDLQVVVALTGEEESPGRPLSVSRRDLIEAGQWSDLALGFESGRRMDGVEFATVARRSSTGWLLEVEGTMGHSSRIFSEEYGAGAINEAARILHDFYEEIRGEELLTFNAGLILGGTELGFDEAEKRGSAAGKTNVISQTALVRGDIRTISGEQLERTREGMREVVAQHLPGTSATITFTDGYPAMTPEPENYALLRRLSRVNQDLGNGPMEPLDPGARGAADISFVAPHTPALSGMGPYGSGAHSPDEALELGSLKLSAVRAAILMHRIAEEGLRP